MKEYREYVQELSQLTADFGNGCDPLIVERVGDALNGEPAARLKQLVGNAEIRAAGAFFTGPSLSKLLVSQIAPTIDSKARILDPACGSGDLLLACAEYLPQEPTASRTMRRWSTQLSGRDLHPEFIQVAKLRIGLAAAQAFNTARVDATKHLAKLRSGCGLAEIAAYQSATHILLNPPFVALPAPKSCSWRQGQINAAALFLEKAVECARPGTYIAAILPDVIRSGSGYAALREMVQHYCRVSHIQVYGRFSRSADVDVFTLCAQKRRSVELRGPQVAWFATDLVSTPHSLRFGDLFRVSVGTVVDYRDPHRGPWRRFLTSKSTPGWETLRDIAGRRRSRRPVLKPPFVLVKRTSSPSDAFRATASIVVGDNPVAIENHLLVLQPNDKKLKTCRKAMTALGDPRTSSWLNDRIRCRHLTVGALSEIPWWPDFKEVK